MKWRPAAKRRVCIIKGHPDATGRHLCHAPGEAYGEGAMSAGLEVSRVDIGAMVMPAVAYRFTFAAHGVRTLSRSILGMAGIRPVRETLVRQMRHLGARAA